MFVIIHINTNSCLLQFIVNNLVHFSIFENDELLTKFGSGDQDSVIPLLGTRTLVNKLAKALRLNTTLPYSAWFHNHQVIKFSFSPDGPQYFATLLINMLNNFVF